MEHDDIYDNLNLPSEDNEATMPTITLLRAQEYLAHKFLVHAKILWHPSAANRAL
jgi:hypothetical protein